MAKRGRRGQARLGEARPGWAWQGMARTPTPTQSIIADVCAVLRRNHIPDMDERLRSIVGAQIKRLLAGGWPADEIRRAAVDLALAWDEARGHNRLTHLQQRMRLMDAEVQRQRHAELRREERAMAVERHATIMAGTRSPTLHDFQNDGDGSCRICTGPLGVHVKPRVDVSA